MSTCPNCLSEVHPLDLNLDHEPSLHAPPLAGFGWCERCRPDVSARIDKWLHDHLESVYAWVIVEGGTMSRERIAVTYWRYVCDGCGEHSPNATTINEVSALSERVGWAIGVSRPGRNDGALGHYCPSCLKKIEATLRP